MMQRQNKKSFASTARFPIWIQRKEVTPDGEGGLSDAWIDYRQVFASVDPIQAKQVFQYKSISVDASHLIRVSGQIDIQDTMRIRFNGRLFEILTVENIQEIGVEKVITCKEILL
jgi:SPP1 family predicted phage head-tail adaptor